MSTADFAERELPLFGELLPQVRYVCESDWTAARSSDRTGTPRSQFLSTSSCAFPNRSTTIGATMQPSEVTHHPTLWMVAILSTRLTSTHSAEEMHGASRIKPN
jgi:hypothetical protein